MDAINLIWLHGQSCTGDTVSLIGARRPSLVDALTGILPEASNIVLAYHPTIMAPWGEKALSVLDDAQEGKLDPFVLILEGSIPDEEQAARDGGYYCIAGEKDGHLITVNEQLLALKDKAAATVAVGTCASYGGVIAAKPNPTGAMGLLDFFGRSYRSTLGLPVICVSGCPAPGDHYIKTLVYLALVARGVLTAPPELDEYNRPVFLYGELAHHICPRCGYYAHGDYSHDFGEPYCMALLGCKGPISYCNVPRDGFTEGYGGCPTVGAICIGCTEPEFPDGPFSPFFKKAPVGVMTKAAIKDTIGHVTAALTRLSRRRI